MRPPHILVVDDEQAVRQVLERALTREGFSVASVAAAAEMAAAISQKTPDLVLLDYNMPGATGREATLNLRRDEKTRSVPVIIVTGYGVNGLPVDCLQAGADDFVAKPFDVKELIERIRAVLRRPRAYVDDKSDVVKGPLTVQPAERQVLVDGRPTERLTPKEFDILYQIVLHSPKILEKNTLALKVWGQTIELLHERTLDVHIRRIRAKLGGDYAQFLVTVPSVGYQWLELPPADSAR